MATGKWVRAGSVDEVPEDGMGHEIRIEGLDVALFQWDGTFYAMENFCPHLGFPLTEGVVQDGAVICGGHGWRVRLSDGGCRSERDAARTYACDVRGNDLYVEVPVPE